MWWSAWSRHQTLIPVAGSSLRCSQERHRLSNREMASAEHHHSAAHLRLPRGPTLRRWIGTITSRTNPSTEPKYSSGPSASTARCRP